MITLWLEDHRRKFLHRFPMVEQQLTRRFLDPRIAGRKGKAFYRDRALE
jgi:hypothetical protein